MISDQLVRIAKPYLLRKTPFQSSNGDTTTRAGIEYNYSTVGQRTATRLSDSESETQVIVPSYVSGDIIYAMANIGGGTGVYYTDQSGESIQIVWLDLNVDARAWAKKFE